MKKTLVAILADQAGEPDSLSPFARFKDLARRLVAVPKAELDERQATDQRRKSKKDPASAP